jgi:hypothetical protein
MVIEVELVKVAVYAYQTDKHDKETADFILEQVLELVKDWHVVEHDEEERTRMTGGWWCHMVDEVRILQV